MTPLAARLAPFAASLAVALGPALCPTVAGAAQSLSHDRIEAISNATYEVVVLKPTHDSLTYERPLPLDQIPYAIRKDHYYSVGTAFAIGRGRWVTAAHVLGLGQASLQKTYRLRDRNGKVYDLDQILKLSLRRDFAVFSIKGDPAAKPFALNPRPRMNDKVYAVGNALGQGIVIRDGLYTSRTPEERSGAWNWIRFSAAASPGNSGGPLLDQRGRVIGVVERKSQNENLNYALPISEVMNAKDDVADIDTEITYQIDNMANLSQTERLQTEIALPKTYAALDAELIPLFDRFGEKLKDALFAKRHDRIFPNGRNSAGLLNSTYNATVPGVLALGRDGNWDAFFTNKTRSADLGANGHLTYGEFYGTQFFYLEKPDDVKLGSLYTDSKLLMDLLLRGNPLYRNIGSQSIRIVSMGAAAEASERVDAYGRKWLLRLWNIEDGDERVAVFALPVPGGVVGMMRRVPTARMAGHLLDMGVFADDIYVSYYGTFAQWREFLAQRDWLARVFDDIHIDIDYGKRFAYASRRLSFSYGPSAMAVTPDSDLRLQFSYFTDAGKVVWDVAQVVAGDDKNNSTIFAVARTVHPDPQLDDKYKARWDKIVRHKHPFDKSAFLDDERTLVADVVPGDLPKDALARAPLLYTAYYAVDGKAEQKSVEAKLGVFLDALKIKEY